MYFYKPPHVWYCVIAAPTETDGIPVAWIPEWCHGVEPTYLCMYTICEGDTLFSCLGHWTVDPFTKKAIPISQIIWWQLNQSLEVTQASSKYCWMNTRLNKGIQRRRDCLNWIILEYFAINIFIKLSVCFRRKDCLVILTAVGIVKKVYFLI